MGIEALIPTGTFFAFLYEFAELSRVKTTRSSSILGVVIEHAVLVVMHHSHGTGDALEIVEVEVLVRNMHTLI